MCATQHNGAFMQVSGTHNAVSQFLRRLPRPQAPAQLLYPDRVHVCAEPRKEPRGRPEGATAAGKRAAEPQEGDPLPRKRGRPLGSRNKPKPATPAQPAAPVPKKEAAPVDKKDAAPVSKKKATPVPRKKAAPVPKKKAALAPADAAAPTPKKRGRPPGSPNKVKKVCPRTCPYLTAGLHARSFLAWLSPKHCWLNDVTLAALPVPEAMSPGCVLQHPIECLMMPGAPGSVLAARQMLGCQLRRTATVGVLQSAACMSHAWGWARGLVHRTASWTVEERSSFIMYMILWESVACALQPSPFTPQAASHLPSRRLHPSRPHLHVSLWGAQGLAGNQPKRKPERPPNAKPAALATTTASSSSTDTSSSVSTETSTDASTSVSTEASTDASPDASTSVSAPPAEAALPAAPQPAVKRGPGRPPKAKKAPAATGAHARLWTVRPNHRKWEFPISQVKFNNTQAGEKAVPTNFSQATWCNT